MSTPEQLELADERIVLRLLCEDDAPAIYEAVRASIPELSPWLSWVTPDYALSDTSEFLAARARALHDDGEHSFAMMEKSSGRFLGGIGINQVERAALRANLGYWLRTSATGQGYATAAVRLLARWALEQFGLERIEIVAAVGNRASQRVAERAGATREGTARCRLRVGCVQHDAVVYSLVRGDFRAT